MQYSILNGSLVDYKSLTISIGFYTKKIAYRFYSKVNKKTDVVWLFYCLDINNRKQSSKIFYRWIFPSILLNFLW